MRLADAAMYRAKEAGGGIVMHSDGQDAESVTKIDQGHNLSLHVVAEGVETAAALDALRELGCDSAHGFHLAVPMPLGDLALYLGGIGATQVGDH